MDIYIRNLRSSGNSRGGRTNSVHFAGAARVTPGLGNTLRSVLRRGQRFQDVQGRRAPPVLHGSPRGLPWKVNRRLRKLSFRTSALGFTSVCAARAQVPCDATFLLLMGSQPVLPYGGGGMSSAQATGQLLPTVAPVGLG